MIFDRDTFFDAVKKDPFDGTYTQEQVDGIEADLGTWESFYPHEDLRYIAYCMATDFHETGSRMWPIEEIGKGSGKDYGKVDPETGQAYYGRGKIQLTWRENYARADKELDLTAERSCEWYADNALILDVACRVLFRGMLEGWFTGKKLSDYFNENEDDPVNARQIVNGNDCDDLIAGYHYDFLDALKAAEAAYVPGAEFQTFDHWVVRVPKGVPVQVFRVMSSTSMFPVTAGEITPDIVPPEEPSRRDKRRARYSR